MRILSSLALLALAALFGGCGYSTGLALPDAESTVGVEIFGNNTKVRDLEADLNSQITDAMERMVHAELVSPKRANYVVRGTLVEYTRRNGIRSKDNVLLETGVRITVQARLIERGAPVSAPPIASDASSSEPAPTSRGDGYGDSTTQAEFPPPPSDAVGAEAEGLASGERVVRRIAFSSESGFRLEEPQGESDARDRVLRTIADRLVMDLFTPLAYEGRP